MGKRGRHSRGQDRGRAPARVGDIPFKNRRTACTRQTNAEMLQLDAPLPEAPSERTEAADEARARLAKLTESDNSLKAFARELRKVLEHADVLLEVLDVRDPLGCRAYALEQEAQRLGKRVVLVLNKIDLVPADVTRGWLAYLRHEFPTLPFKASTQQQRNHLAQGGDVQWRAQGSTEALAAGAEALGARAILQLIKNYSRNLNLKTSITVGIVGAPNVGKSSLINSLKRARVCSVASTPGHTKVVQGIMLDRHVRLLDCPGIVFTDAAVPAGASPEEIEAARLAALLRNVLKAELVEDPIEPVQAILARVEPSVIAEAYGIPEISSRDPQEFLLHIALQRGRLARGGVPDLDGTARSVLHDWNVGKIRFYTTPPKKHPSMTVEGVKPKGETAVEHTEGAAVLSQFSEAFDLAGLLGEADAAAFGDGHMSPPHESEPELELEPAPEMPTEETAADLTDSTLGKRVRDDSDNSDDDEERIPWRAEPARKNHFALLADDMDDEELDDDDWPEPTPKVASVQKRKNDRDLFSAAEREGMVLGRAAARRKARKDKKKRRAETELIGAVDSYMDFAEDNVPDTQPEQELPAMFRPATAPGGAAASAASAAAATTPSDASNIAPTTGPSTSFTATSAAMPTTAAADEESEEEL
ncbi:nuclear GTP-binding protein nug1 [Malassezia cuniculi]|uniref:Nuclear GTP-binding protein nug1 n=1 Tax=Malassezia cuniculi TaxID=948313 RepID=A0AAF0EWS3_9BASI|nr:nuclear GTP-binding protein nug1 [Malassezia cuniculi]